jgi:hypothetical protein
MLHEQDGHATIPVRLRLRNGASYEVWDLDARASTNLIENLERECTWLRVTVSINGDAVISRFAPQPRPWERRQAAATA